MVSVSVMLSTHHAQFFPCNLTNDRLYDCWRAISLENVHVFVLVFGTFASVLYEQHGNWQHNEFRLKNEMKHYV